MVLFIAVFIFDACRKECQAVFLATALEFAFKTRQKYTADALDFSPDILRHKVIKLSSVREFLLVFVFEQIEET